MEAMARFMVLFVLVAGCQRVIVAVAADPVAEVTTEAEKLPGNGLAQHDFLYTGEWDTRNPTETMSLVRDRKVVWKYEIPDKDPTNGQLSEFSDMHRLSNGDIVFAYKTGWRKIESILESAQHLFRTRAATGSHSGKTVKMRVNNRASRNQRNFDAPKSPFVREIRALECRGLYLKSRERMCISSVIFLRWLRRCSACFSPWIAVFVKILPERRRV
jgi:hypothetical protein